MLQFPFSLCKRRVSGKSTQHIGRMRKIHKRPGRLFRTFPILAILGFAIAPFFGVQSRSLTQSEDNWVKYGDPFSNSNFEQDSQIGPKPFHLPGANPLNAPVKRHPVFEPPVACSKLWNIHNGQIHVDMNQAQVNLSIYNFVPTSIQMRANSVLIMEDIYGKLDIITQSVPFGQRVLISKIPERSKASFHY